MPLTSDVSKNIRILTKENKKRKKKRSRKQIIAIAIDAARRKGRK
jgi:hypothetical protein